MKILLIFLILTSFLKAEIGKIVFLKGSATITRDTQTIQAKLGLDIEKKDIIKVDKKSKMQVMLKDETVITLGANTNFEFEKYNDSSNPQFQGSLHNGFMRTISGNIGKIAPNRFKINTPSATIGIRGTMWESFVSLKIENHICYSGEIYVKTDTKIFSVPSGFMLLITDKTPKKYKADEAFFNKQVENSKKTSKKDAKIKNEPQQITKQTEDILPQHEIENSDLIEIQENISNDTSQIVQDILNNNANEELSPELDFEQNKYQPDPTAGP